VLQLFGAHLIGADVSELLPELTLTAKMNWTSMPSPATSHAHPTLSEAVVEAVQAALDRSIQA